MSRAVVSNLLARSARAAKSAARRTVATISFACPDLHNSIGVAGCGDQAILLVRLRLKQPKAVRASAA
jgi:hypothetical protein